MGAVGKIVAIVVGLVLMLVLVLLCVRGSGQ